MMQRAQQSKTNPGRLVTAAVWSLGLLLLAGELQADEGIEIRNATTRLEAGVWFLDADIDYRLNETAREALDSGLELDVELTIRLTQRRRIIWNSQFAELKQLYSLQYHALTGRYILRNLNSGEQTTFGSLPVALNALGSLRGLPVIDDALLNRGERYYVSIRAIVDIEDFGGPLAIIRLLWNDWRISSDWIRWRLVY